jgi:hypothetical protein
MISNQTNGGGFWNNAVFDLSDWGLVDVDGGSAWELYAKGKPIDNMRYQLEQASQLRENNPSVLVWNYRNSIKMIPYYPAVREILSDPRFSPWFLSYRSANATPFVNPQCDVTWTPPVCSTIFHDEKGWAPPIILPSDCGPTPCDCGGAQGVPCSAFYLDFRRWNDAPIGGITLRDWYLQSYINVSFIAAGLIQGYFLDDDWDAVQGPAEAAQGWQSDTGLTGQEVADIADAYWGAFEEVKAAIVDAGGFTWQDFVFNATDQGALLRAGNCATNLREYCKPGSAVHDGTLFYGFSATHHSNFTNISLPGYKEDLARFLLFRGPYAFIGYPWVGVNQPYYRPPELDEWEVGIPLGLCREVQPDVFVRHWSNLTVELNCTSFTASFTIP